MLALMLIIEVVVIRRKCSFSTINVLQFIWICTLLILPSKVVLYISLRIVKKTGLSAFTCVCPHPAFYGHTSKSSDYNHRLPDADDNYLLTLTDDTMCHCHGGSVYVSVTIPSLTAGLIYSPLRQWLIATQLLFAQ